MGLTLSVTFQRLYERFYVPTGEITFEITGEITGEIAFVKGIKKLDYAVSILNETDIVTLASAFKAKRIIKHIKKPIRQAHEYLSAALQLWQDEDSKLSGEIEKTIAEMHQMKLELSKRKIKIEEMNQNLNALTNQLNNKKQELENAKRSLDRANNTLSDSQEQLEQRKREQMGVAIGGLFVTLIPFVGWVFGPAMVVISVTALEDAVKVAKQNVVSAEENIKDCERRIPVKETEQRNLQQQLSVRNEEKREMEKRLKALETRERRLQEEHKISLKVVEKLKNTCHFMTKIWGKSNVLQHQTGDYAYSLEPLFVPLMEIAEMLTFEEQNKLKITTLLSKDIDSMTSMSSKMKAICGKTRDASLDDLT